MIVALVAGAFALVAALVASVFALITGVTVAIVTAKETVRHSLQQFRSERWWERRDEAYSEIVRQLAELQYTLGELESVLIGESPESSKKQREELQTLSTEATKALRIASAVGAYAISQKAADAVQSFLRRFHQSWHADPVTTVQRQYDVVRDCISLVRQEAHEHLSQTRVW